MFKYPRSSSAIVIGSLFAASAGAGVVYQQDFENPSLIGSEWSSAATDFNQVFTRFSERRTNQALTLTIGTITGQAYALVYDLYLIDSWDGDAQDWGGPDRFNVRVGNSLTFSESMDNDVGSLHSSFRDPDASGHFGYGTRSFDIDAIYRSMTLAFVATGPTTAITFFGSGLQGKNDESWGIDNVSVAAVPVPGPGGALVIGAAGLALARRRERMAD